MAVVNQRIIRPLVYHNFGMNALLPTWTLQYEESENLNTKAERYTKIHAIGLPLSKAHLYNEFQTQEPVDENDILGKVENPDKVEFAEKKKLIQISDHKLNSKTERFKRLRPSMIEFLNE
jgi:phage gp29-like protein